MSRKRTVISIAGGSILLVWVLGFFWSVLIVADVASADRFHGTNFSVGWRRRLAVRVVEEGSGAGRRLGSEAAGSGGGGETKALRLEETAMALCDRMKSTGGERGAHKCSAREAKPFRKWLLDEVSSGISAKVAPKALETLSEEELRRYFATVASQRREPGAHG